MPTEESQQDFMPKQIHIGVFGDTGTNTSRRKRTQVHANPGHYFSTSILGE